MLRGSRTTRIVPYNFGQPALNRAFGPIPREKKGPKDGGVKVTKMANGTKIVSHDLDRGHVALGIYVEAGPKFDPLSTPGLSYVMRFGLLSSNFENSLFQIDRAMRSTGFSYGHAEVQKRFVALKAEGRRDQWSLPFRNLGSCLTAPRFHEPDVERFRDTMDNQLQELRWNNPREYCVDALESVAFFKEPLGSPRMVPPQANDKATCTAMLEHYAALYVPSAVTIAGVNVAHEELVAAYETLTYPHSADSPHHAKANRGAVTPSQKDEAAQFHAGRRLLEYENRAKEMGTKPDMEDEVIAAVGWLSNGSEGSAQQFATALVHRELLVIRSRSLANAASGSAGVRTFYRPYASAGLVGFTCQGKPSEVPQMVRQCSALFSTKDQAGADAGALALAKARAAAKFRAEHLEVARDYVDFLGTSSSSAADVEAAIEAVKDSDVANLHGKAASQSPAIFATGKTHDFTW